jgi:RimJ/RimL family protein N-acetyltransferase
MFSPREDRTLALVRPATLGDAEALRNFKRLALSETEYLLQGLEDFDDHTESERDLIGRFLHQPTCLLLVAVIDNRIVGLCSIVGGHLWRTRHVGTMSIGVLRQYWRHGVASRLMRAALRWAQDHPVLDKLSLQVHASNTPARLLYLGQGFVEEGLLRREARLGDDFDDLVPMGLLLRKPRDGTPPEEDP